MIIYNASGDKVKYYKWCDSYGNPHFGTKKDAWRVTGDIGDAVMRQLKMKLPDCTIGFHDEKEKFKRAKKPNE